MALRALWSELGWRQHLEKLRWGQQAYPSERQEQEGLN